MSRLLVVALLSTRRRPVLVTRPACVARQALLSGAIAQAKVIMRFLLTFVVGPRRPRSSLESHRWPPHFKRSRTGEMLLAPPDRAAPPAKYDPRPTRSSMGYARNCQCYPASGRRTGRLSVSHSSRPCANRRTGDSPGRAHRPHPLASAPLGNLRDRCHRPGHDPRARGPTPTGPRSLFGSSTATTPSGTPGQRRATPAGGPRLAGAKWGRRTPPQTAGPSR